MAEKEATADRSEGDRSPGHDSGATVREDDSRRPSRAHGDDRDRRPSHGREADDGGSHSRPRRSGKRLTAGNAAQRGLQHIAELTGKQADGVAGVEPADDGWVVGVEVVEDRRVPSSTDILAIYQVELDHSGELLSYRRIRRYRRSQSDGDYAGESW